MATAVGPTARAPEPLGSIAEWLERGLLLAGTVAFATLIITVALQVLARNVLGMSMGWTLDLAQLLFAWCIFLGAAIAVRRNAHYRVELIPEHLTGVLAALGLFAFVVSMIVVGVLLWSGWTMLEVTARRHNQALGISQAWFYAAIPCGAAASAVFLLERVSITLQRLGRARDGTP
jgi:TRAP-type C4-dicarboxylate transport system permease small subunit